MKKIFFVVLMVAATALAACDKEDTSEVAQVVEPAANAKPAPKRAGMDDRYATKSPQDEAQVGQKSSMTFRIEPRGDLKINKEYPWKIEFAANDSMALAATSLGTDAIKLTEEAAEIPLELLPSAAGKATLTATGNFSVCNPQRCDILRDEPLEFSVVAVASETQPDPAPSEETTAN